MNNERTPTLNGWPAGPNAFGLYLVLGVVLALIVIGVFAVLHRDVDTDTSSIDQAVLTKKGSVLVDTKAGSVQPPGREPLVKPARK